MLVESLDLEDKVFSIYELSSPAPPPKKNQLGLNDTNGMNSLCLKDHLLPSRTTSCVLVSC